MEIEKPLPETEDIVEFEFVFVGNIPSYYCLVPDRGDTVYKDGTAALMLTVNGTIHTVYLAHVLCSLERHRTRTLPDKELKPGANSPRIVS